MAPSRNGRAVLVTVGLAAAGFGCGTLALGGGDALALLLRPDGTGIAAALLPAIALLGGALGAVVLPAVAWIALRRAPLWQVLVFPALGAALGHALEWTVFSQTTFAGAAAGVLLAVVALAARSVRSGRGAGAPARRRPGDLAHTSDPPDAPARLAPAERVAAAQPIGSAARVRVRR